MILANRSPLVLGYSGWENDVFMTALSRRLEAHPLSYNLYWFCFRHEDSAALPAVVRDRDDVVVVVLPEQSSSVQSGRGRLTPDPVGAEAGSRGESRSSRMTNTLLLPGPHDPEEIVLFYEESLTEGFEGIIAKRLDGTYDAGKRGFNWIKMKRSYQTQLRDTVDCAIVGYYYGKGRRARWGLGSLLVSVYDKESDTFPTVTRVASGLSEEGWQQMFTRLSADKIEHPDPRVKYVLGPDVWVVPRYVLELQADEVTRSQMHAAGKTDGQPGYALRFPRIVKERPDREPEDATSVSEIIKLYGMQGKGDTRGTRKPSGE